MLKGFWLLSQGRLLFWELNSAPLLCKSINNKKLIKYFEPGWPGTKNFMVALLYFVAAPHPSFYTIQPAEWVTIKAVVSRAWSWKERS